MRDGSGAIIAIGSISGEGELLERKEDEYTLLVKCAFTYTISDIPDAPVYTFEVRPKAADRNHTADASITLSNSEAAEGFPTLSLIAAV